jgi:tetratricopeptide (TPR) repeat protein
VTPWAILAVALFQSPAQRASALVDAGIELSHAGKFNEAGARFVEAIKLDPTNAEAHHLLGLVRQHDGRAVAALESFRTAARLQPSFAPAHARVCELETTVARGRDAGFAQALANCQKAAALNPQDPESRFHSSWLQAKLGNQAAAIEGFRTVLKLDPEYRGAKFELAMALADAQRLAEALPLLEEVVAAEPANGNARFQLGSALAKSGNCDAAVSQLEAAADTARTQYLLAQCYKRAGRAGDAATAMAKVREKSQGVDSLMQAKFLAASAQQRAEAGRLDDAIADYRAALQLVPDPSLEIDLAVALLRKGDAAPVLPLLAKRTDPVARYQVALAHTKLGRLADARALLELVVKQRPTFAEAWYSLGALHLMSNSPASAEPAFIEAVRLRPDEPAFSKALTEARRALGR